MTRKQIILLISCLMSYSAYAQETIVSSGGDFKNTNGSISYSIGQNNFQFFQGTKGNITEGIQQSFEEIQTSISKKYLSAIELFPNPTNGIVSLKAQEKNISISSIEIINNQGKKVLSFKEGPFFTKQLDLSSLKTGLYYIRIKTQNNLTTTLKMIKK